MTRVFGRYVPIETLGLYLADSLICFLAITALLQIGGQTSSFAETTMLAAVVVVAIDVVGGAMGLYRPESCHQTGRLVISTVIAALILFPVIALIGQLSGLRIGGMVLSDVEGLFRILIAWTVCLVVTRFCLRRMARSELFIREILVVGETRQPRLAAKALDQRFGAFFRIDRIVGTDAAVLDVASLRRRRVWGVVVAPQADLRLLGPDLRRCKAAGIHVFRDTEFHESHLRRLDLSDLDGNWVIFANGTRGSAIGAAMRRLFDVVVSLAVLLPTLPLMLLTAALIRLDSSGPIFYRQERVGLDGVPFELIKFRSMRQDAETSGPRWAAARDQRVTRIGRIIRRIRVDELPQLFNVLRGEMSMIGPRPERPFFVQQLSEAIPRYRDRSMVKPGITGWAQVNYPYGASIEDARMKLSYDLYYVKNRSLLLDLLIIVATIRVVLFQEGSR